MWQGMKEGERCVLGGGCFQLLNLKNWKTTVFPFPSLHDKKASFQKCEEKSFRSDKCKVTQWIRKCSGLRKVGVGGRGVNVQWC